MRKGHSKMTKNVTKINMTLIVRASSKHEQHFYFYFATMVLY